MENGRDFAAYNGMSGTVGVATDLALSVSYVTPRAASAGFARHGVHVMTPYPIHYPVYVVAKELLAPAADGSPRYDGFYATEGVMEGGLRVRCLMLFTSPTTARQSMAKYPGFVGQHIIPIKSDLDLEFLIADARRLGITLGMFDHSGNAVLLAELAQLLDAQA